MLRQRPLSRMPLVRRSRGAAPTCAARPHPPSPPTRRPSAPPTSTTPPSSRALASTSTAAPLSPATCTPLPRSTAWCAPLRGPAAAGGQAGGQGGAGASSAAADPWDRQWRRAAAAPPHSPRLPVSACLLYPARQGFTPDYIVYHELVFTSKEYMQVGRVRWRRWIVQAGGCCPATGQKASTGTRWGRPPHPPRPERTAQPPPLTHPLLRPSLPPRSA